MQKENEAQIDANKMRSNVNKGNITGGRRYKQQDNDKSLLVGNEQAGGMKTKQNINKLAQPNIKGNNTKSRGDEGAPGGMKDFLWKLW